MGRSNWFGYGPVLIAFKRQKRKASIGDPAPAKQRVKTNNKSKARETSGEEDSEETSEHQEAPEHQQAKKKINEKAPQNPSVSGEESDKGEGPSNAEKYVFPVGWITVADLPVASGNHNDQRRSRQSSKIMIQEGGSRRQVGGR